MGYPIPVRLLQLDVRGQYNNLVIAVLGMSLMIIQKRRVPSRQP